MAFRPLPARDRLLGWIAALALILISAIFLIQLLRMPLGPLTVILGVAAALAAGLAALLLYRLWALHSLDYWIDRDAVRIHCRGNVVTIPLERIQQAGMVENGRAAREDRGIRRWLAWPARWIIPLRPGRNQPIYATQAPAACIRLTTPRADYFISPADPDAFLAALSDRRALGPARKLGEDVEIALWQRHWLFQTPRPALVMVIGLLLGLAALAYLIWHYPALPADVPIHFDANGVPDRISPRRSLFLISFITLSIGFFNAAVGFVLYERQRLAAYLLWGSALVIQIAGWLVIRNLITLATG